MNQFLRTLKGQLTFKIGAFICQNHKHAPLRALARTLAWLIRHQHGRKTLDFLEIEDSIDHLDYSKHSRDE